MTMIHRRRLLIALFAAAMSIMCVADPKPDIPQDVGSIDPDKVRVNPGSGSNRVLVTGLDGAVEGHATRVRAQNLLNGGTVEASVSSDGTFTLELEATPTQVLGLTVELGDDEGNTIFVAGNAEREAVQIGEGDECELVEVFDEESDEPIEECLLCRFDGGEELVGCELNDFFEDEAPLNPANVAECLFLETDFVELEPEDFEGDFDDIRFAQVSVFNNCGEFIFLGVRDLATEVPERFFIGPGVGDEIPIDPTFFGVIEVFYDGTERDPDQADPDVAEVILDAFVPLPEGDELLGTMQLTLFAP